MILTLSILDAIKIDGLLLKFSRPSIYIEGSLEKISDLTSTPSINLSHQTLH